MTSPLISLHLYTDTEILERHKVPLRCPTCNKTYKTEGKLITHIQERHK